MPSAVGAVMWGLTGRYGLGVGEIAGGPVATIRGLVGVYNARGTVSGELAYFIGARLGRTHCALCDVTHGFVRERPEWKKCRQTLAVPFATYHLNDRPLAVSEACGGVAPVVLAETDDGMVMLLGPDGLSACSGSVERFANALVQAAEHAKLAWPT
jgi:hypothetical protein